MRRLHPRRGREPKGEPEDPERTHEEQRGADGDDDRDQGRAHGDPRVPGGEEGAREDDDGGLRRQRGKEPEERRARQGDARLVHAPEVDDEVDHLDRHAGRDARQGQHREAQEAESAGHERHVLVDLAGCDALGERRERDDAERVRDGPERDLEDREGQGEGADGSRGQRGAEHRQEEQGQLAPGQADRPRPEQDQRLARLAVAQVDGRRVVEADPPEDGADLDEDRGDERRPRCPRPGRPGRTSGPGSRRRR